MVMEKSYIENAALKGRRYIAVRGATFGSVETVRIGNIEEDWFELGDAFDMIWAFLQSKSPAPVLLATLSLPQKLRRI